jgi:hypothetical protein
MPQALAIFNLNRPDWSSSMTSAQLKDSSGRLRNLLRWSSNEPANQFAGWGGFVDIKELARFDAFVSDEIHRRNRH